MELNKEELKELISNVEITLNKVSVYANYSEPELNKDGSVRKNSRVTYEAIEEAKEREFFLKGLLTKLNKIKPTED